MIDDYATHISLLAEMVILACQKPDQRILEIGAGEYSTPLLHRIGRAFKAKILTFENNSQWLERYKDLQTPWHELRFVQDWKNVKELDEPCALAFVDHDPANRRIHEILRLKDLARYIVVHGSHKICMRPIYALFKYKYIDKRWNIWTTVFSNLEEI